MRLKCKCCTNIAFCWCFNVELDSWNSFFAHLRVSENETDIPQSRKRCKLRWSLSSAWFWFFLTDLHKFVSPAISAKGTCNVLVLLCVPTQQEPFTGSESVVVPVWSGVQQVSVSALGYAVGLGRRGRTVIPSPLDASLGVPAHKDQLKEWGQCQQIALQDVVSAGYRAAYGNCAIKPTPQQKKTMDLSEKMIFSITGICLMQ